MADRDDGPFDLVLLRFYALPTTGRKWIVADDIVDTLIAAIATSILVTLIILVFIPPQTQEGLVVIEPWRIEETLERARRGTREWWYRGHSGRHFRAVTLPALALECQSSNQSKAIHLLILDPTDAGVCQRYAAYRSSLRSAKTDRPWTEERIRLELNATIIATMIATGGTALLDTRIAVIERVSTFRVDQSDTMAIITKEDPREPALRVDAQNFLFWSYREDLRMSFEQSAQLQPVAVVPSAESVTEVDVKRILTEAGLGNQDLSDGALRAIVQLVKNPLNPYQ